MEALGGALIFGPCIRRSSPRIRLSRSHSFRKNQLVTIDWKARFEERQRTPPVIKQAPEIRTQNPRTPQESHPDLKTREMTA